MKYFFRITPADAGKTVSTGSEGKMYEDHPRGCGENSVCVLSDYIAKGSPPRMRGKLLRKEKIMNEIRITPADAGKTTFTATSYGIYKDHPRGCGENLRADLVERHCRGSPPRMRGKPI